MNWITNVALPKIRKKQMKDDGGDALWQACPACEQMLFTKSCQERLWVCEHCEQHLRVGAKDRLAMLFDEGGYAEIALPSVPHDPLKFQDLKKYADRLKIARKKTGLQDALLSGFGSLMNHQVVISAMDFSFMGGSMGSAVGEGFIAGVDKALDVGCPFIVCTSSGGARMQEGLVSLMQMVRTTIAVQKLREHSLPFITLLGDPTTGGVMASFGMLGDFSISEPTALLAFSGARVISGTTSEQLPEGFQSAEYLLQHGMIDQIVPRSEQREALKNILDVYKSSRNVA